MTVSNKTYENINPLFHNALSIFSKEEIEQSNIYADNWYYKVGVNVIPCYVQSKNDKYISILNSWAQYQKEEISQETFENWKELGLFAYGIGVITGKIYRTENKGKFLTIIDIDKLEAVERFAECSGKDIKDIAKWTRVEWHENINSYHIFLITQKQFKNIGAGHGLEVHANNNLIFTSNSIHPDGKRWKAIDNELITVLTNVIELSVLQIAIDRYLRESTTGKMGYDSNDNNNEEALKEFMAYINNPNIKLTKGQRNPALYAQAKSYFFKYTGEFENLSDDAKLVKLKEWLDKQCEVPLTQERGRQNEVEEVWNKVKRYFTGRREKERNKREDELKRIKEEDLKRNPGMCEKKQIQSAILLKENIKSWLSKDIWTIVSEDPIRLIVTRQKEGDIVRVMVEKKKITVVHDDDDKEEIQQDIQILNVGTVIFRVYPIKIVLHESPLKFLESPSTYSITFEDQINQQFTLNGTVEQIIAQLKEYPGCVISAYGVSEVLNAVIAGFRDDGKLEVDSTVDFEGYYYHNDDICMSKIDLDTRHPVRTREEVIDCCNYLDERAKFQVWKYKLKDREIDRRDLLSSAIQWTIAAPFNFAIKQITNKKYWIKIFDFSGERWR